MNQDKEKQKMCVYRSGLDVLVSISIWIHIHLAYTHFGIYAFFLNMIIISHNAFNNANNSSQAHEITEN